MGLVRIYGIFEIGQLVKVWNKYNKRKINDREATEYLDVVNLRQNYFWTDEFGFINSEYFSERESVDYIKRIKDVEYFMPKRSELNRYIKYEYDTESVYYKKMLSFLEKNTSLNGYELTDILDELVGICVTGDSYDVNSMDNLEGELHKKGKDVYDSFLKLFYFLSNNTRYWIYCGYTKTKYGIMYNN